MTENIFKVTEKEVKIYIGEDNWKDFCNWMIGQTIGGHYDTEGNFVPEYYDVDVRAFKEKLDSGYDRQSSPEWD